MFGCLKIYYYLYGRKNKKIVETPTFSIVNKFNSYFPKKVG